MTPEMLGVLAHRMRPEALASMGQWMREMAVTKKQAETGDLWQMNDDGFLVPLDGGDVDEA